MLPLDYGTVQALLIYIYILGHYGFRRHHQVRRQVEGRTIVERSYFYLSAFLCFLKVGAASQLRLPHFTNGTHCLV